MSRLHQLRWLLWKNCLIKKRYPLNLVLETLVPFVLFIILGFIRYQHPPLVTHTQFLKARALPSSGIITTAHMLVCGGTETNNDGLPLISSNSTLTNMLGRIDQLYKYAILESNTSHSFLHRMSVDYGNSIDTLTEPTPASTSSEKSDNDFFLSEDLQFLHHWKSFADFTAFHEILESLTEFASSLPQESCQPSSNPSSNTTGSESSYDVLESIRAVLCQSKPSATEEEANKIQNGTSTATSKEDKLSVSDDTARRILIHLFRNNPKVLYTPGVNSIAELVMKKSNRTFETFAQITEMAQYWLSNARVNLHRYFTKPTTPAKIQRMQTLQARIHKLYLENRDNPDVKAAIDEEDRAVIMVFLQAKIRNASTVLEQLDTIDRAACWWLKHVGSANLSFFLPFDDEHHAVDYALHQAHRDNVTVLAIVSFDVNQTDQTLPAHTTYKIRMNSTFLPSVRKIRDIYWSPIALNWDYFYYFSGFSFLQDMVDRAIVDTHIGHDVSEPGTFATNTPLPCYLYDTFLFINTLVIPLSMAVSFVYLSAVLVQNIVYEKEHRLKEFMKVMGLSDAIHAWAWFITAFVQLSFCMTGMTLLLRCTQIFLHSDPVVIWLLLETYAIAIICFAFLVSSFFSKSKIASATGGMLHFLSYAPAMCISVREDIAGGGIPAVVKHISSLLSTSALALSCKHVSLREAEGVGVHWDNIFESPIENDSFSLAHGFGYLILDSVLYGVVAWYVEQIHPGKYGIPRPWYFPLTKSYWSCLSKSDEVAAPDIPGCSMSYPDTFLEHGSLRASVNDGHLATTEECSVSNYFEHDPTDLVLGVEIKHLKKVFRNTDKAAVNGLNLNLYESQITALLGHNGAGKTSTMSVLTGILPPTSGTIRIYGKDMFNNLDVIRSSVGFCPQHDVLFEQLTPEEHLQFYSGLKRRSKCEKDDIEDMLRDVGLATKASTPIDHLSGGMKRKLSIALAFIGRSRLVVLDEPTAGVDPFSRRAIWDLIAKYKVGRTILVSTHHMAEADVLADRIAIISNGKIKSSGSSIFLKNTFCDGYHLVCVKSQQAASDQAVEFIKSALPSAYLNSESRQELHFVLPYADQGSFPGFFKALQHSLESIGLTSYGVYDAALEEAVLRITHMDQYEESQNFTTQGRNAPHYSRQTSNESGVHLTNLPRTRLNHLSTGSVVSSGATEKEPVYCSQPQLPELSTLLSENSVKTAHVEGTAVEDNLWLKQFGALFVKRLLYMRRNWKVLFAQTVLFPTLFISIAMSVALSAPNMDDAQPLVMSPAMFYNATKPRGLFTPVNNLQPAQIGGSDAGSSELMASLHLISGLSSLCTVRSKYLHLPSKVLRYLDESFVRNFNPSCYGTMTLDAVRNFYADKNKNLDANASELYYPMCRCAADFSGFICPRHYNQAPVYQMVAGDYLIDIGTQNMSAYLVNTDDEYRRHRYGALTFGNELEFVPPHFGDGNAGKLRQLAVRRVVNYHFEHRGFHSLPAYLNVVNNAILRANVKKRPELGNPAAYGITTYNHPINGTDKVQSEELAVFGTGLTVAVFIVVAMAFVPASFVGFLVSERVLLVKHAHFMAGLHPFTYWLANYVWDMLSYLVSAICCILVLMAFNVRTYADDSNWVAVVLLVLFYGWATIPLTYPASWHYDDPSRAYVHVVVINLFIGTTCLISSCFVDMFKFLSGLFEANNILKDVFLVFPSFAMGRGFVDVAVNHHRNEYFSLLGDFDEIKSPLTWEITLRNLVVMAIEGYLFFGFVIAFEYLPKFRRLIASKMACSVPMSFSYTDDADVIAEQQRVRAGATESDLLVIDGLTKVFCTGAERLVALDRLTLGLPAGECFGLLGLNGAGKSTAFSMLSGILQATAGTVMLFTGRRKPKANILRYVGYCPQTDPLIDELTARGHLELYARLRGVSCKAESEIVSWLLESMGLEDHADKPSRTLSGGTKRKLSAALALIGDPSVLLLDEPTRGMDPDSRRFLWNLILQLRRQNRLVILTSHNTQECEVLCNRLGFMVAGKLRGLGSTQQLKHKFGSGYLVTVRMPELHESQGQVRAADVLRSAFDGAAIDPASWRFIVERHRIAELELLDSNPDLGAIFNILTSLRLSKQIVDFSVSQNSLDNVFLQLTYAAGAQPFKCSTPA